MIVKLISVSGLLAVLLRAAILCFLTIAVGGIVFLLLVARPKHLQQETWLRPAARLIRFSALGLAFSQLLFVLSNTLVLTATTNLSVGQSLGANYVLAAALAISAGLTLFFWPGGLRDANLSCLIPAGVMIAALVMTSHAASRMQDRFALCAITTVHYVVTAAWIGGLPFLLLVLKNINDLDVVAGISRRFSKLAQVSVTALFLAGIGMSLKYVGSWDAIYGTSYGAMVMTKLIFFGCLLLLGTANFFLVRAMGSHLSDADTKVSLLRFAEVELGIGITVILTAASLTSQPPGVDLPQDRATLHEIVTRYALRMPQFSSPDSKELSESATEVGRSAKADGRKLPPAFVPGDPGLDVDTPADIAWSEYNHTWAGVQVLAIGVFALLSRSRYFKWAKAWPLLFLGLAVFVFLRSDPENWPVGPRGFWGSFAAPDVLQHRVAVILVIAFAIFQWRVETGKVQSRFAALVFPAVCALGGIVLLTHSHGLNNVKQSLLIELSHTPLAICAVIAGWSRWLEIRLPQSNPTRRYLAWVWPMCFILIGLILLNYHEADKPLLAVIPRAGMHASVSAQPWDLRLRQ